jgi:hypothetical protein
MLRVYTAVAMCKDACLQEQHVASRNGDVHTGLQACLCKQVALLLGVHGLQGVDRQPG